MSVERTTATVVPEAVRRRNRLMLVTLFGIAAVTWLLAWFLQPLAGWLGTTNQGRLLEPMVTLERLPLVDPGQRELLLESGKWRLLVVSNGDCAAPCQEAVHTLRQLHVLLAKDAGRVRRLLLATPALAPATELELHSAYPKLEIVRAASVPDALGDAVYVMDPLGNVILEYPYADAGKPLMADLKKLLRVSRLG